MGAALLSLGAGAALIGASCKLGPDCEWANCPTPEDFTCPWRCSKTPWDGTTELLEDFDIYEPVLIWTGDARDAPDCASINAYHYMDLYQDLKPIDRCPGCTVTPLKDNFFEVALLKGGHCDEESYKNAYFVSAFVVPVGWDGGCLSEKIILDPDVEGGDIVQAKTTLRGSSGSLCLARRSEEEIAAAWGRLVRVCRNRWPFDEACPQLVASCVPPAPGFRDCIKYLNDDVIPECPRSHPELVRAYSDIIGCDPCRVAGRGSWETSATVTLYADEQCTQPIPATRPDYSCYELPPGAVPRSVSAAVDMKTTSTCTAETPEMQGEPEPGNPESYCCTPERTN